MPGSINRSSAVDNKTLKGAPNPGLPLTSTTGRDAVRPLLGTDSGMALLLALAWVRGHKPISKVRQNGLNVSFRKTSAQSTMFLEEEPTLSRTNAAGNEQDALLDNPVNRLFYPNTLISNSVSMPLT